jgi:hypothetical protein
MYIALVVLGVVIVAGLAFYAGKLLSQLNEQKVKFAQAKAKQAAVRVQRIDNIMMSVHTIALAVEQQQCDLSEGVIRLTNLLDALPLNPAPQFADIYPNIYQLHAKIADFATHEARAALTKKVRHQQDQAREAIEANFESAIITEVTLLRDYHPTI